MSGQVTAGRFAVLSAVEGKFDGVGRGLGASLEPLGTGHDRAAEGAGQFAGVFAQACVGFLVGWREVVGLCEESAGLAGEGVRAFGLGLRSVDAASALEVRL
ncbi:MAG: hypothetical protein QG608_1719 [Actinomycetota bacterium]|nr:hypothetical protein [Actinomycetota bacterium]